jgi:hypothetical protein
MSEDTAARVWLFEGGSWELADDPISWSEHGDDVRAKYAEAGYTELPGDTAEPFLVLGLNSEEARPAVQLTLFVRREHPQCLIDIEAPGGSTRSVYAARLPDGLDLMARWAPIAQAGVLTAAAGDLFRPATDHRGQPRTPIGGLVEAVARRAADVT